MHKSFCWFCDKAAHFCNNTVPSETRNTGYGYAYGVCDLSIYGPVNNIAVVELFSKEIANAVGGNLGVKSNCLFTIVIKKRSLF